MLDKLSVFFPAYNEQDNLEQTVTRALSVLPQVAKDWEVIIVNDGSKDKTGEVAQELVNRDSRISVITHSPNRGYGAAVKSGLYHARYPWITFTDADGQFDFSEISNLIRKQEETQADLVIGYYLKREVPFIRICGSKAWQFLVWLIFGLKVRDTDCGFKLIRREVIKKIPPLEAERGPFISSELLIKAKKFGFKIVEIGVHHFPRKAGKATGADFKVVVSGFNDLLCLRKKLQ